MNTIHMMIGIPGSGKTTYARALAEKLNYPLVSINVLINVHLDWEDDKIMHEAYRLCGQYIESSDVIYDARNITVVEREEFINEVKKYGTDFNIKAYYISAPIDVCIKRVIHRNELSEERYFPPEKIRVIADELTLPKDDEVIELITIDN